MQSKFFSIMFVYLPKHELNLALYMRPEDITELNDNEDNKENEGVNRKRQSGNLHPFRI